MSNAEFRVLSGRIHIALFRRMANVGVIAVTLALGACSQGSTFDLGLSLNDPPASRIATASAAQTDQAELQKATAFWAKKYSENPRDGKAALSYARNLKALGRKPEALSVLQTAYMFNADQREYLSEFGRLALDQGQVSTADQLLARADDPATPDWRVLSARGTVMAKQGKFKESIPFFERARALAPAQSSVLNNLAMAYTMDGQATRGEELLRQAVQAGTKDARVQQNLALVLELQGKADDAQRVLKGEPAREAAREPTLTHSATNVSFPGATPQLRPSRIDYGSQPSPERAPVQTAQPKPGVPQDDPDAIIRAAMAAEASKAR